MDFLETNIPGAYIIEIIANKDERGLFARTFCAEEFRRHNLNANIVQQSVSWNPRQGTLRGLHYQTAPHEEEKLVRVTRGAIFDAIVDLRPSSPMYGKHMTIELTADNHRQLYIPKGVAHGFQTLVDDTEVLYEMTTAYVAKAANGISWNDPALNVQWPFPALADTAGYISGKDQAWPCLSPKAGAK